ncbi:hypothetical protein STEG23_021312 [Scotinomys teguina]
MSKVQGDCSDRLFYDVELQECQANGSPTLSNSWTQDPGLRASCYAVILSYKAEDKISLKSQFLLLPVKTPGPVCVSPVKTPGPICVSPVKTLGPVCVSPVKTLGPAVILCLGTRTG